MHFGFAVWRVVAGSLAVLALCAGAACARRADALRVTSEPERSSYRWDLPAGFPAPHVPPDNPMTAAKVELGRHLFHDKRLSGTGDFACSSCHSRERAFTDGRAQAVGATGERHALSSMSLANVAYAASLTWADPEVVTLEQQVLVPMFNERPVELGVAGREDEILARLAVDRRYPEMFQRAFPDDPEIHLTNIARAIASFERTLISGSSPFDLWIYGGDRSEMSESARRGMDLFFSEDLACGNCHGDVTLSGPIRTARSGPVEPAFHNTGLYDIDGRGSYPTEAPGLSDHTGRRRDRGRFRAPTLRNVALTGPYMHDGSIATLSEVIDHYARGGRSEGRDNRYKSEHIRGFSISAGDRSNLLAFLDSLTDAAFVRDPRFGDPFTDAPAVTARAGTRSSAP